MYHLGSDIVTIILAVVLFIAGVTATRKGKGTGVAADGKRGDSSDDFSEFIDILTGNASQNLDLYGMMESEESFDEVDYIHTKRRKRKYTPSGNGDIDVESVRESESVEGTSATVVEEIAGDGGAAMQTDSFYTAEPLKSEDDSPINNIRERIKLSPKDLVIYSEIMNPKYKEY